MNISQVTYSNYQTGFINRPSVRQMPASAVDQKTVPMVTTGVTQGFPFDPAIESAGAHQRPARQPSDSSGTDSNQKSSDQNAPSASTSNPTQPNQSDTQTSQSNTHTINGRELTADQLRVLEQLQQIDSEVRRHEMAHVAAGGRYITSGASFTYQRGPDGRNYAVGGEVGIDTSAIPGDPQATLQKMRQVKSAALAPANPSSQDLKVASNATAAAAKAMSELMALQAQNQAQKNKTRAFGNLQQASNTYQQVNDLPENDTSTFQIAV